jgi:hypothetical protein
LRTPASGELGRIDLVQTEMGRLATVEDCLDNVRRQIAKPQVLPDIAVRKTFRIGKRLYRLKRTARHLLSPVITARNRFDQRLASRLAPCSSMIQMPLFADRRSAATRKRPPLLFPSFSLRPTSALILLFSGKIYPPPVTRLHTPSFQKD